MKCLEIARLKDFAPNTPGLLGVAQGPQTPCREVRDSRCVSTNPPLEIPAYGPAYVALSHIRQTRTDNVDFFATLCQLLRTQFYIDSLFLS